MPRALRPVGERLPPPRAGGDPWPEDPQFPREFYSSGTAALAAVIKAVANDTRVAAPEALIPAYTCPDVVSALRFAGVTPVLVDLVADRPWLDLDRAGSSINERTVAIIGINFLGIPEQFDALRTFADNAGIAFVYDHCQGFPASPAAMAASDYVVFSFGRGKPASALGGGAALVNLNRRGPLESPRTAGATAPSAPKRWLYNTLIRPGIYWLPASLPFVSLGETHYKPLLAIDGLDAAGRAQVMSAISSYRENTQASLLAGYGRFLPSDWNLAAQCGLPEGERLLRLPLLLPDGGTKRDLLERMSAAGLGASPLYPTILGEIPGVLEDVKIAGDCPNAASFASRLMTLPVHSDVTTEDLEQMAALVAAASG